MTILNYYNIITDSTYSLVKLFILIGSVLINSYLLGNYQNKKLLLGIKFSIILIIPLFIFSIITKNFTLKSLLFYLIIISSSITGSIFSKRKKNAT